VTVPMAPGPRRSPSLVSGLLVLLLTTGVALWLVHGLFRVLALLSAAFGAAALLRRTGGGR